MSGDTTGGADFGELLEVELDGDLADLSPELQAAIIRAHTKHEDGLVKNHKKLLAQLAKARAKIATIESASVSDEAAAELETLRAENEEKDKHMTELREELDRQIIENKLREAIGTAGGEVELLLPFASSRVRVVEDNGEQRVVVVGADGKPATEPDPLDVTASKEVTVAAFVDSLREKHPRAFRANGGSGVGLPTSEQLEAGGRRTIVGGNAEFMANIEKIARGEVLFEQG